MYEVVSGCDDEDHKQREDLTCLIFTTVSGKQWTWWGRLKHMERGRERIREGQWRGACRRRDKRKGREGGAELKPSSHELQPSQ